MKEIHFCLLRFALAVASVGVFLLPNSAAFAQRAPIPQSITVSPAEAVPTSDQHPALEFDGEIRKSGSKFVLSTPNAVYQIDDQQRAQSFLNRNVKVTGVLDPANGTIHVQSIGTEQSAN